ncbi:MAG: efflux RND transporter periplasmic adaptor subunit [Candidatus Krumholzibacteria bacterium]|nr:efflux RND transporter periplasmic adaptor subunit [Candidatus Krumholzibacteria bacterium]
MLTFRRFLVLAVAALAPACGKEPPPPQETIRPVRCVPIFATGGAQERLFSGAARADVESNLSFRVRGTVRSIRVKVGDRVQKGTPIAELDPTDYELQAQDAQASVAQALSQARNAKANYERVQGLYVNQNASRADLDAAQAQKESAEAQVGSLEKKLELAKMQLEYTRLVAPVAGSIASVNVEVNENVDAGKSIVMLAGAGRKEVQVTIPEILITQIYEGDAVTVRFDAIPGRTLPGTVTEVGVSSTGFATTYPVKVQLDETTEEVRPGMAAEVLFRFQGSGGRSAFIVPSVAVGEDREGQFVFAVEATGDGLGVTKRKRVTVGELTSQGLEILAGIEDGDLIVTAGVSRIVDGQTVRITSQAEGE